MSVIREEDLTWIEPIDNKVQGHALVWRNIWCVTNEWGQVAVYKKYFLQGNKDKNIAEMFWKNYKELGAVSVEHFSLVILPDSPSRY